MTNYYYRQKLGEYEVEAGFKAQWELIEYINKTASLTAVPGPTLDQAAACPLPQPDLPSEPLSAR